VKFSLEQYPTRLNHSAGCGLVQDQGFWRGAYWTYGQADNCRNWAKSQPAHKISGRVSARRAPAASSRLTDAPHRASRLFFRIAAPAEKQKRFNLVGYRSKCADQAASATKFHSVIAIDCNDCNVFLDIISLILNVVEH